ncbi:SBBP repeat-containing protein [uncultured Thiodictyon sp.]|uniref:SBBP repeat-containing protein n=1 Tax=uncultured Thiodictyon sp. TaxID=1846217 RepID=UPI0025D14292|nr:SBBP repeat-containing protein [uncultured Thiodictyon sp.]
MPHSIALDSDGSLYMAGDTDSSDFPLVNALDAQYHGTSSDPVLNIDYSGDAFIAKLAPNGSSLVYSTYLGGRIGDIAYGVAVDKLGNAYIAGETNSPDFPLVNAISSDLNGDSDAFVVKLSPNGSTLVYSTYLGGSGMEGSGLAIGPSGDVYVSGSTTSADFPVINAIDPDYNGNGDIFVVRLSDDTLDDPRSALDWQVTEIYAATLGYAPDNEGLQYWVNNLQNGGWTATTVAQSFFDQPLVQTLYPADQGYEALIEALYQNLFDRAADADGKAYWLAELQSGRITRNAMIIAMINGGWANADAAIDMARFGNRIKVSLAFAAEQTRLGIVYSALSETDQARLRQFGKNVLTNVTDDTATRDSAIASIPALLAELAR